MASHHIQSRGLTLIEVLVALALLGLLSAMMARGLDGVLRSQQQQDQRDSIQSHLQNSLMQWQIDLQQLDLDLADAPNLDWNGQILRLVRHSPAPWSGQRQVVAWGMRDGRWMRWQSEPMTQRSGLQRAWQEALTALDSLNEPRADGHWVAVRQWQVFFYRDDSWSNALSSSGSGPLLPDAIRLELDLAPQGSFSGLLRWDWVRPNWSVIRS